MSYKIKSFVVLFLSSILFNSCAFVPAPTNVESGNGIVVSGIIEGLDANNVNQKSDFLKEGKACTSNFLYLVNTGDSSIKAAKEDGHIKNVHYIERTKDGLGIWIILPFIYSNVCTVVYGE